MQGAGDDLQVDVSADLAPSDAREQALRAQAAGELSAGSDEAAVGVGASARRVLVHASGFKQSPYADVQPAGVPANQPPRKLWHSSPGSSGR